ncbi:MAG TPA: DUF2510 domain-containing protein [Ilumatobacter sp.]|nr:DUF2510 domain-containing protein [Ilumatobacter sp.]
MASDGKWYPPQSTPRPPAPPLPIREKQYLALAGAAAIVIGSFMPWATATTFLGNIDLSGFDGDGKITAAVGALALVSILAGHNVAARVLGLIVAAIGIYDAINVESIADEDVARISSAYGLWMVITGGVIVLVQPALRRNTGSGAPLVVSTVAPTGVAEWKTDPNDRHELRWWDGQAWTDHVSDDGITAVDRHST